MSESACTAEELLDTAAQLVEGRGWRRHRRARQSAVNAALTLVDAISSAAGIRHPDSTTLAAAYATAVAGVERWAVGKGDEALLELIDRPDPDNQLHLSILEAFNARAGGLADVVGVLIRTTEDADDTSPTLTSHR